MSDERIETIRKRAKWLVDATPYDHGTGLPQPYHYSAYAVILESLDSLQKELDQRTGRVVELEDALRLLRSARDELTKAVMDDVDVGTYQDYYDDRETAIDEAIAALTPHSTKDVQGSAPTLNADSDDSRVRSPQPTKGDPE